MRITPLVKTLNPSVKALPTYPDPALSNYSPAAGNPLTKDSILKREILRLSNAHYTEFGNNSRNSVLLALGLTIASLFGLILGLYFISIGF
jgi:hypothetical protein